jgi:outer membrane receptor for ferrienterochelin and colicin
MMIRKNFEFKLFVIIISVFLTSIIVSAGTTGKIAGVVTDETTGEPLVGVNVIIKDTFLGSSTDENGEFFILNVPPGVYDIEFMYIGYNTQKILGVTVKVDLTTSLETQLNQQVIEGETIEVIAEKPVIQKDATASATVISASDLRETPVESFQAIAQTKADVTKDRDGLLHIRGGRSDEILYLVDGIPVNNPFDNKVNLSVSTNAIEELSIISGAFNAEYGKAMSGVINIVTKEGTKDYEGSISFQTGDILSRNKGVFTDIQTYDPFNTYEIEGNLSGYIPFFLQDNLTFAVSARYFSDDGYLSGVRQVQETTKVPGQEVELIAGDSAFVSMNPSENLNLHTKLKLNLSNMNFVYSNIYRDREFQSYVHSRFYAPYGQLRKFRTAMQHSFAFTHVISNASYYTLNLSYINDEKQHYAYIDPVDERYDWWTQLERWLSFSAGANGERSKETANSYYGKFDFISQITKRHLIRAGFDYRYLDLRHHSFEVSRTDTSDRVQILTGRVNDVYHLFPYEISAYLQDKIEFEEIVINVGARLDYYQPNADGPDDYDELASSKLISTKATYQISPRLSVAHLVSANSKLYYSYGHFFQIPPYERLFRDYESFRQPLVEIRTGILSTIIGNPNLKPQKTVSYEVGYEHKLSETFSIFMKGYYKNITNLLDTEIFQLPNGTFYAAYINRDYGNVRGFSFTLNKSLSHYFLGSINYTFQQARGNSSNPNQAYLNARNDRENLKKVVPLDWDQPHALRINLQVIAPNGFGASVLGIIESGYPYTHEFYNKEVTVEDVNRARKPTQINFDLNIYKNFNYKIGSVDLNSRFYIKIYNVFNRLNENYVWDDTGTARFTLDPNVPADWVRHPHWYSKPRTIFTGIELSF